MLIVGTCINNEATSIRSLVDEHVPGYIYILHTLVTLNPERETRLLYPLLKILKHSTSLVFSSTVQIYNGFAVAIDASPWMTNLNELANGSNQCATNDLGE